jgi:hypothetical protein
MTGDTGKGVVVGSTVIHRQAVPLQTPLDCASADPSSPLALSEGRCGSLLSTRCRIAALLDEDMVGWQKERAQASV